MSPTVTERRLAAILSADVVGYSRLMAEDEAGTIRTLGAYRDEIRLLVDQHRGRVADFTGDNFLAEFPTALDAVECAAEAQRVLRARNAGLPEGRRMEFRMGLHLGDVTVEGERLYGDGVNIAARLEGLAEPGGVCISGTVVEQIRRKLQLDFDDLGEQTVKNIPDPVHAYRLRERVAEALPQARRRPLTRGVVLVAGVAVVLGVLTWRFSEPESARSPSPRADLEATAGAEAFTVPGFGGAPAIAVLPFDNLSGDPDQEYFADGLAEELLTRLSLRRMFPVIARNSSFVYKGQAVDVKRIGRDLGARYVVEGSVRKAGDRVRVTAQLIDSLDGHHVWAETYDRELRDVFDLQDEISQAIAEAAGEELSQVGIRHALREDSSNLDARDLFLRGLWHFGKGGREENSKAREYLEQAIDLDPQFARALLLLAQTHQLDIVNRWTDSPERSAAEGLGAAEACMSLEPTAWYCHLALASAYQFAGQPQKVIEHARQAVRLNPSDSDAHVFLGWALASVGGPDEAVAALEKALRLSPRQADRPFFCFIMGWTRFAAERYEDAAGWMEKTLRLRDWNVAHRVLAASYAHLGRVEEARAAVREALRLDPDLTVEGIRLELAFVDPGLLERYFDGLRLAGLPED